MEAAKSLINRYYDKPHFLQKISDNIFETDGEGIYYNSNSTIAILKGEPTIGTDRS